MHDKLYDILQLGLVHVLVIQSAHTLAYFPNIFNTNVAAYHVFAMFRLEENQLMLPQTMY